MKNIIWQKSDGGFAVTSLADHDADSAAHAAHLKTIGSIPPDWTVYAVDTAPPAPPPPTPEQIEAEESAKVKADLAALDLASISALRELVLDLSGARPLTPAQRTAARAQLEAQETVAGAARVRLPIRTAE